ncbi:MAG TPA: cation:proton antiporter [Ignavibacteria bacterium]|nr:sodium:proton exchanger [Bacteroidota bacterium]HRI86148.1 cation:proton antiporter [Ignavibacteria bacterium]HRK00360.1 cation:proton antiporter [Ignavibacteria bacterium]
MKINSIRKSYIFYFSIIFLLAFGSGVFASGGDSGSQTLLTSIGIAILAASVMAFIAHFLKQPLLLAYISAGIIIGPKIGFGFIVNEHDIETISHIGLVLLLFMIGLEIDVKKIKEAGKSLFLAGTFQFIICVTLGLGFFSLLGFTLGDGNYDLLYLAVCCSLSSTAIVVKLLYSKLELDTLAGRLTLGILIFQDIWAIIALSIQANLASPDVMLILFSFVKGALVVLISLLLSKYVLSRIFRAVAKNPEIVLITSLGWCFLICGLSGYFGLSLEMGALIAGVAISTFPYNHDVISKIIYVRDFFITLFFVALGMMITNPADNPEVLIFSVAAALFLIASRFMSIYPILYALKNGNRVSLLTSINLSQISEFSLVIAALGLAAGHISQSILTIIIFTFVITSVASSYMIKYSDSIQRFLSGIVSNLGFRDIGSENKQSTYTEKKEIAILGFFTTASSLIKEMESFELTSEEGVQILNKVVVIDFNPEVHKKLSAKGIKAYYGDISHIDTLLNSGIEDAKIVISTIPDSILVNTNNLRLLTNIKKVNPQAKIIVTAESPKLAVELYENGAHYVLMPRVLTAQNLMEALITLLNRDSKDVLEEELEKLKNRNEIIN